MTGEPKNTGPFVRPFVTPNIEPKVAAPEVILPSLDWVPTVASGSRGGEKVVRVVVHRWGVAFTSEAAEARSYEGVINEFKNPKNDASAHIVYPGSAVPGKATQMVAWNNKAWTEAAYNPSSDDIESADAIWLGKDPHGFKVLARIVAQRLQARNLPAIYSAEKGFCRHADLGVAGGGHTACPTTNMAIWHAFVAEVQAQAHRGGFPASWGR